MNFLKREISKAVMATALVAGGCGAVVTAILFASVGSFVWLQETKGTVTASFALATAYFLAGLLFCAMAALHYRSLWRQTRPAREPETLGTLSGALRLTEGSGIRRFLPLAAISAILILGAFADRKAGETSNSG